MCVFPCVWVAGVGVRARAVWLVGTAALLQTRQLPLSGLVNKDPLQSHVAVRLRVFTCAYCVWVCECAWCVYVCACVCVCVCARAGAHARACVSMCQYGG